MTSRDWPGFDVRPRIKKKSKQILKTWKFWIFAPKNGRALAQFSGRVKSELRDTFRRAHHRQKWSHALEILGFSSCSKLSIMRLTTGDLKKKARNFKKEPMLQRQKWISEIKLAKIFWKVLQSVDFGSSFVVSWVASNIWGKLNHHYH